MLIINENLNFLYENLFILNIANEFLYIIFLIDK